MPVDVIATLRRAFRLLEREKTKLESRIVAIRVALDGVRGTKVRDGEQARRGRRSGMSAAARKAVSQRMKAYWARRRARPVPATGGSAADKRNEGPV